MLETARSPSQFEVYHGDAEGQFSLNFSHLIVSLRRNVRLIILGTLVGLLLAATYLAVATPRYTAVATVLIDPHKNELLEGQQVSVDPELDLGLVESQTQLIRSEEVARATVRDLHLLSSPEFDGSQMGWLDRLRQSVRWTAPAARDPDPEGTAARSVALNTDARRVGASYAIEVAYSALSPSAAAAIANGLAEAYVDEERSARYESAKRYATWFESRLAGLKETATRSDAAVQDFKTTNNIVDTGDGTMIEEQLSQLDSQLAGAKAAADESKARLDRINQVVGTDAVIGGAVPDALHNDVINRLRGQYLDLSQREREISQKYGPKHSAAVQMRGQMAQISTSIADEMNRIAQSYKSDFQITTARVSSLQLSLDHLVAQVHDSKKAQVRLRDLQSSAQNDRALYDSYLQKFSQASQQQTVPVSEARVISPASTPLKPSTPKPLLALSGGLVGGFIVAFAIAFWREITAAGFRTVEEVASETGLACLGILPEVSASRKLNGTPRGPGPVPPRGDLGSHAIKAPLSRFAETLRSVKVAIDAARKTRAMQVIGVTSALPKEGKSLVAANLAHLLAATGHRTLLIDGDLRNPDLSRRLSRQSHPALVDLLANGGQLAKAVERVDDGALHFLSSGPNSEGSHSADALSSDKMNHLLQSARSQYDYIVVDFAPMGPVVDVRAASNLLDGVLFVVEWEETSRDAVRAALKTSGMNRSQFIGIVLNRADVDKLRHYERANGKNFDAYYIEA